MEWKWLIEVFVLLNLLNNKFVVRFFEYIFIHSWIARGIRRFLFLFVYLAQDTIVSLDIYVSTLASSNSYYESWYILILVFLIIRNMIPRKGIIMNDYITIIMFELLHELITVLFMNTRSFVYIVDFELDIYLIGKKITLHKIWYYKVKKIYLKR